MTEAPRRVLAHAVAVVLVAALAACGASDDPGGPSGGDPPGGDPPPDALAEEWLAAHNAVRAAATPAPDPALPPLGWSAAATSVAQAWADRCEYRHNDGRGSLGENIAANTGTEYTATRIVGLWASEGPFYDLASNTCDASNPDNEWGTCGHYTQLVWRDTALVGCARRTCTTNSPFPGSDSWEYWVCDYDPPGNWIGERPY
jgi:hypothetical protein